jgi:hypothetical protein
MLGGRRAALGEASGTAVLGASTHGPRGRWCSAAAVLGEASGTAAAPIFRPTATFGGVILRASLIR